MKVAIVGTGYVGLVTGTCLADMGHEVTCIDIDAAKIARLQRGDVPIYEPGLQDVIARNVAIQRLHFTTDLSAAAECRVIFLALPTPQSSGGAADVTYVLRVADDLGPILRHYTVVVDKSTVPVGTAERVRSRIAEHTNVPFDVVSNPEFLREGYAVHDFMHPDRLVIGTSSQQARAVMDELYAPLAIDAPLLYMTESSAELAKYAANAFLAMKITFMNHIANLCERVGADVDAVGQALGSDERIGPRFLAPGIGYGGSCFPKDVHALLYTSEAVDYEFDLLEAVIHANIRQQKVLTRKVMEYFGDVRGKNIALWGLAFKQNTDDIREAPALGIIEALTAAGAHIKAYDPQAMGNVLALYGDNRRLSFAQDALGAARGADALLIATEWPAFREVPLPELHGALRQPVVFDGRNLFTPQAMQAAGFHYESIGRPVVAGDGAKER